MRATRRTLFIAIIVLASGIIGPQAVSYAQQPAGLFGAPSAQIPGQFWTEESWIVNEIVHDITEMAAYAEKPSAKPLALTVETVRPGLYRVSAKDLQGYLALDLTKDIWDPATFQAIAEAALGKARPRQNTKEHTEVYQQLTELTPFQLTRTSNELSRDLSVNMRNRPLHEAAALTVGAFALRESAGRFNDVRGSLNRMTAHLAMARVLGGTETLGIDGQLAESIRLTLSAHQTRAMKLIESIEAGGQAIASRPWTRALRMRMTQDWRQLPDPASASLLEKFEYLRARRATTYDTRAAVDFGKLNVKAAGAADWPRILQAGNMGLEEGQLVADTALALEQLEIAETFTATHPAAKAFPIEELNARATRCISNGKPQVISWGAWAEFSQRHLALLVSSVDYHFRHMEGVYDEADLRRDALDAALKPLTMHPVAAVFRMKGKGKETDLSQINGAIRVAVNSPERIMPAVWNWLERGAPYELVRQGMPKKATWFYPPSERMPYDAASRAGSLGTPLNWDDHAVLSLEAPYEYRLLERRIYAHFEDGAKLTDVMQALGARMTYDLRAIDVAIDYASSDDERFMLLRNGCTLNAAMCARLGAALASMKLEHEAAKAWEQAFSDSGYYELAVANECEWLVRYYLSHGRTDDAVRLAERAAAEYSSSGLATAAWLYEKMEEFDKAEKLHRNNNQRYGELGPLLGFYHRLVVERHEVKYEPRMKEAASKIFPDGLQPAPGKPAGTPGHGVIVNSDNSDVIKARFQAGDIIVAANGYRVDNYAQYRALRDLRGDDEVELTLWRGVLFKATIAWRSLVDVELRTYPITGFVE